MSRAQHKVSDETKLLHKELQSGKSHRQKYSLENINSTQKENKSKGEKKAYVTYYFKKVQYYVRTDIHTDRQTPQSFTIWVRGRI